MEQRSRCLHDRQGKAHPRLRRQTRGRESSDGPKEERSWYVRRGRANLDERVEGAGVALQPAAVLSVVRLIKSVGN